MGTTRGCVRQRRQSEGPCCTPEIWLGWVQRGVSGASKLGAISGTQTRGRPSVSRARLGKPLQLHPVGQGRGPANHDARAQLSLHFAHDVRRRVRDQLGDHSRPVWPSTKAAPLAWRTDWAQVEYRTCPSLHIGPTPDSCPWIGVGRAAATLQGGSRAKQSIGYASAGRLQGGRRARFLVAAREGWLLRSRPTLIGRMQC